MASVDALRRTFVLANAFKEGDLLVGGTVDEAERAEARQALLGCRVGDIRGATFVDDGVTEALERTRDRRQDADLDPLTIERIKDTILGSHGPEWVRRHRDSLSSEVIAALAKVMSSDELGSVSRRLFNPLPDGIGAAGHFGSRIQPNSPGDDDEEILFSILEGLTYGCGDVVIGLNPAADERDRIVRLERLLQDVVTRLRLPTRFCVLSDLVKQHAAKARTAVDVGFQSLAGTSRALTGMVGLDVGGILDLARGFDALYFETGQGSAVTNGAAEGVDMVTLESRAYGVARHIQRQTGRWTVVNDVAGFIGPEVFRSVAQLERACLEDLVMAKLHGLTMGLDVCATFHMGIAPAELRDVTARIVSHGAPAYLMAVAGSADPMLGYLTTPFRQHPELRDVGGNRPAPAMQRRLDEIIPRADLDAVARLARLYATYAQADDSRSTDALEAEGRRKVGQLQERGFDIALNAGASDARLTRIYEHARRALYARLDDSVVGRACAPNPIRVRTAAADREEYVTRATRGERLREEDVRAVRRATAASRGGAIQLVVSDGLNAHAVNEQLPDLLGAIRRVLANAGRSVAEAVVVIENGRVRAGYHVGQLVNPEALIHLIGERPGTGLNSVSAYVTWGRDAANRSRWDPQMDHALTTAVCGIHRSGKPPDAAAAEIGRAVQRMFDQRRSGVSLD
jgi:ethanolamine ammonia-lyase large subunit